jgi:cellulose synthase/poly-beta-1,6-N-acetylglucosamine synthase-like glycosyltransferase
MKLTEYVVWACLILVIYTYLLYPVLLFLVYSLWQVRRDWRYLTSRRNRRASRLTTEGLPAVTLVVPAYNEETHLEEKIVNVRGLDYPSEKLEIIFVSDGSTDRTNEILGCLQGPNIQTMFLPVRRGKPNALNQAVARSQNGILIFSDASTLFAPDAISNLVRHFSDPRVGVVCGSLQFRGSEESHQTEGVYWKYESMMRLMEARLGETLTASGAIYALRRECYSDLPSDTLIDDFVVPLNARKAGYEVLYDPEAVATEFAASSVAGEFTRRVRVAAGSFQALGQLFRVPLNAFTCWAFFSHKVLRWIIPFLLIGLLVSNGLLLDRPLYRLLSIAQLLFYIWAVTGFALRHRVKRVRYALLGYFLLAIHVAFFVGFVRFLAGRWEATWQRAN